MKKIFLVAIALALFTTNQTSAQSYGGLKFNNAGGSVTPNKETGDSVSGKNKAADDNNITVSYSGFDLKKSMTGRVSCGVTFSVENNTPYRLVKFAADLDWTGIYTSIDFSSIEPNTAGYVRYRLLGEGCYTMVTAPEITVLRCRLTTIMNALKDMSFDDEDTEKPISDKKETEKKEKAPLKFNEKPATAKTESTKTENTKAESTKAEPQIFTQEECAALVKWRAPKQ
ncbi:MAG: hypothetical protein AB7U85_02525 [Alphaproteobacteria bacterium]